MSDQAVRLENWQVINNSGEKKAYLCGEVYGHPRLPDGRLVTTSAVIELHDDTAVTRSGTVYRLGKQREQAFNKAVPCVSA
jgi:hypothetical protein